MGRPSEARTGCREGSFSWTAFKIVCSTSLISAGITTATAQARKLCPICLLHLPHCSAEPSFMQLANAHQPKASYQSVGTRPEM